jgi:hypothetical protein
MSDSRFELFSELLPTSICPTGRANFYPAFRAAVFRLKVFIRRLLELPMIGTNDDDWLFLSLVRHQRIIKLIAELGVSITQEASLICPTNLL